MTSWIFGQEVKKTPTECRAETILVDTTKLSWYFQRFSERFLTVGER